MVVAVLSYQLFMFPRSNPLDKTVRPSNLSINDLVAGRKTYLDLQHHYNDDPHQYVTCFHPFNMRAQRVSRSISVVMGGVHFISSRDPHPLSAPLVHPTMHSSKHARLT